jgi:hypothetical protein
MDKAQKQKLINDVTNYFRNRTWFNGAGFEGETLIVAYNFYPALDIKFIKEAMQHFGIHFDLRDIKSILPGQNKDDVPPYVR